jgi:hypothetical protein
MIVKAALSTVVVCAMAILLLPGNASAQFASQVKVSDTVEGNPIPGLSAARCGTNIVVGFADSEGASAGTTTAGPGFAVSKNNGATFSDLGVLSDLSLGFGGGDSPVIACSSSSLFYYATVRIFADDTQCAVTCTQIAVSPSVNGGTSWNAALPASTATFDIYQLQSPSIAIDPSNPQRMYAAYINHNFAQPNDYSGCDEGDMYILEVVASADGGKTWNGRSASSPGATGSPNLQPDHTCNSTGFDTRHTGILVAPSVVVSPSGAVYVAYEFVGTNVNGVAAPNEIRFTRSLDHGTTYGAPLTVSNHAINNALPEIGVDRTHSPHRGEIFVTWSGAPAGTHTDVLVSDSLNGGTSFSFPQPISPAPGAGTGRFQSNPVIAVDNDGQVQACFYNAATNTPTTSTAYSYNCATSINHAATWQTQKLVNSAPAGYDAVTSDFLTHHDGFFTPYELQTSGQKHVVGQFSDIN